MDQGYATVNASAFFCNMAGCANRSITELIRLMGRQCLAREAEPVIVAGSIPVALTSVILIEGPGFLGYRHVAETPEIRCPRDARHFMQVHTAISWVT
jgi:hypothetical protein